MDAEHDWYEVLGVPQDCPHERIRSRYLNLIHQISVAPSNGPKLSLVHEAFRMLGDPVMRAGYDRARAREREDAEAMAAPAPAAAAEPGLPAGPRACPFCEVLLRPEQAAGPDDSCARCGSPLYPARRHATLQDSRRLFDRLPFTMRIHFVRRTAPNQPVRGISVDLSLGGLRLITPVPLDLNERVMLECEFCAAVAAVKRVQKGGRDQGEVWECGLQFITLAIKRQRGGLISASA